MILIVHFGSQTAHLIARRLRDIGVETVLCEPEDAQAVLQQQRETLKGIILSGGPSSVYEAGAPTIAASIFELGVPVLGICYGWQLMAHLLKGSVEPCSKEYGPTEVHLQRTIFGVPVGKFQAYLSHGDSVTKVPKGFEIIGSTNTCSASVAVDQKRQFLGVQFHPEASHTRFGDNFLKGFAHEWCGEAIVPRVIKVEDLIQSVRNQDGLEKKGSVLCAVSGGVDSTVMAAIIARAVGERCLPIYIESGLMRIGTKERVERIFRELIPAHLVVVHAEQKFLDALKGVTDFEQKRKIIGKLYIDLFEAEAAKHTDATHLGQGTIYSDVIESKGSTKGSAHASQIRIHHNVAGLPKDMKLKLVEPLKTFYKDEVRKIGTLVGLPEEITSEQPFPGPGFAIRIRGEVTPKRLAQVKQADAIVVEEVKKANLYGSVFQCFAVMTGASSTAVKGDHRELSEVVALRAYESVDIMTSQWAHLPYELLQSISSRIVNEVPDVSRVVYDITTKPPATMEWE